MHDPFAIYKSEYDRMVYEMGHIFTSPRKTHNRTPKLQGEALAQEKGLQSFDFNGTTIYAKNEKEAVKRAKKRGLL